MKPNTNQPWWRLPLIGLSAPIAIAMIAAVPMLLFMPDRKAAQAPPPVQQPLPPEPVAPVAPPAPQPASQSMVQSDDTKFKAQPEEQMQVPASAPNVSVNNDLNNADVAFRSDTDGSEQSGCGWVQSAISTATNEPVSEDQSRQLKDYASRCKLRY